MVFTRPVGNWSDHIGHAWNHDTGGYLYTNTRVHLSVGSGPLMRMRPSGGNAPSQQFFIPAADDPSDPRTWSVQHVFPAPTQLGLNTWNAQKTGFKHRSGITKPNAQFGSGGTP